MRPHLPRAIRGVRVVGWLHIDPVGSNYFSLNDEAFNTQLHNYLTRSVIGYAVSSSSIGTLQLRSVYIYQYGPSQTSYASEKAIPYGC